METAAWGCECKEEYWDGRMGMGEWGLEHGERRVGIRECRWEHGELSMGMAAC